MPMRMIPIPTTLDHLTASMHWWAPFIPDIAKRSPHTIDQLLEKIYHGEVQPILAFDDGPVSMTKPATALMGISIVKGEEDERVAELVWMTGRRRDTWTHLIDDLEKYLREHLLCVKARAIARPGWRKFLEQHGYKQVREDPDNHVVLEKVLTWPVAADSNQ